MPLAVIHAKRFTNSLSCEQMIGRGGLEVKIQVGGRAILTSLPLSQSSFICLPPAWVNVNHPQLDCEGFSVEAWGSSRGGVLSLSRSDLDEEVVRRKEALEQKKRIEFKP